VILGLSCIAGRLRHEGGGAPRATPRIALRHVVPWFIIAFLVMVALRSLELLPEAGLAPTARLANILTVISMAALGLGVDVRVVAKAGMRVTMTVTLSLLALGTISFALIKLLGIA
jgi:uncharacterized membrane protein YadS